jgi:hypothetical protein
MKKITTFLIFLFSAFLSLHSQSLTWDIKFLKGNPQESVPISRQIRMETGDTLQLTINPETDCFCYVIFYDSERQISVLRNAPIQSGVEVKIGPFELEEPSGVETFYVIMSLSRQSNLESLIQAFNANSNSRQNANNLYNEVANLQKSASNLGEPASSFVASGGTTRGTPGETSQQATRFSGKNIYVRAITIRH